jgi:hypothetical protein
MSRPDPALFDGLIDQLESAVSASGGLSNISEWLVKNTSHPTLSGKPWSFKDHEYQIKILNDTSPEVVVRKSTQIGASEFILRLALALLAKLQNTKALYVLPSQKFASKFASSRIDPVIAASERLKALADRNVNSTEIKKIGSSFLFLAGAASPTQAISIPGRVLIIDELAFCNPSVLSVFASRLGHQKDSERIIRKFSSPLFPKSDISKEFEAGNQQLYLCWHEKCSQWVVVDALEHIILPGYNGHLTDLSYAELVAVEHKIPQSFVKCEHCHQPISIENLRDPAKRAWVPKYPDREISSYDADPLVLPEIRTPERILKDLLMYKNTVRWLQYSMGKPAESASDMILASSLDNAFTVNLEMARSANYGAIGMDVGKTSHITTGKRIGDVFHVTSMETTLQDGNNATGNKVLELQKKYLSQQIVIDAMPDVSIVKSVQDQLPIGMAWGCYFVSGRGKSNLEMFERKDQEGVVSVARTRALDEFVSEFNKGRIRLPKGLPFEAEVKAHLSKMKRIINLDGTGEEKPVWITTDEVNHWFFSVFYCWLADQMMLDGMSAHIPPGLGGFVSKVKMRVA